MEKKESAIVHNGAKPRQIPVIGFGRRLAATLLDGVILYAGTFILILAAGVIGVFTNLYTESQPIPVRSLMIVCGLILSLLYYVLAWSKSGQTIANSVLGIKIVGADGKPLPVGRALLRYIGYIISALCLSIGFLWVAFDKKRQGWHDKIASSYAVDGEADFYGEGKFDFVPEDTKPGWAWLVVWLVIALVAPSALLSSLFIMGPALGRAITGLLVSLR